MVFRVMSDPRKITVELRGAKFEALDFGGGGLPPVIFTHGTGLEAHLWKPYAEALSDRFHCYALNARGHGGSSNGFESFAWGEMAADLISFIDHFKIARPVAIGHSMGAATIVLAEGLRPGSIGRAVLIDPIILQPSWYQGEWTTRNDMMAARTLKRRHTWPSHQAMIESFRDRAPFDTWQPEYLELYAHHGTEPSGADSAIRLKCTPQTESRCYLGGHQTDPAPAVAGFTPPTMLLRGAADTDTRSLTLFKELGETFPDVRTVEIKGGTHFVPMERPADVLGEIDRFIAESVSSK